jgi:hypothetical protein
VSARSKQFIMRALDGSSSARTLWPPSETTSCLTLSTNMPLPLIGLPLWATVRLHRRLSALLRVIYPRQQHHPIGTPGTRNHNASPAVASALRQSVSLAAHVSADGTDAHVLPAQNSAWTLDDTRPSSSISDHVHGTWILLACPLCLARRRSCQ